MTESAPIAEPAIEPIKTEAPIVAPEISPDLLEKKQALKAVVTTHNLLIEGCFSRMAFEAVNQCLSFLKGLHEQITKTALAHPDADKDPELKTLKEKLNGETKNQESL